VELRRFDLLFVRGRSLIGRLVQAVTRSPYSHVAIVLDEWHVAETDWKYPLKVRHLTYPAGAFDVMRYRGELMPQQLAAMERFLHEKLTTPYDYLQSITNGLYLLVGISIRDAPGRMNCSETVDRMFAAAGIDLCPAVLGHVTPADLARSEKLQKIT
jgi:hypothetical protein